MPKLIPEIRERLINEVKRLINNGEYSLITIRTVSQNTGIAAGTVYNYFPSKDMLVASVVAEDWEKALSFFDNTGAESLIIRIEAVYNMLVLFIKDHEALFNNEEAKKKFASLSSKWHNMLREQIARLIAKGKEDDDFLYLFISESLLSWAMEDTPFEKLGRIIMKLIQEEI